MFLEEAFRSDQHAGAMQPCSGWHCCCLWIKIACPKSGKNMAVAEERLRVLPFTELWVTVTFLFSQPSHRCPVGCPIRPVVSAQCRGNAECIVLLLSGIEDLFTWYSAGSCALCAPGCTQVEMSGGDGGPRPVSRSALAFQKKLGNVFLDLEMDL